MTYSEFLRNILAFYGPYSSEAKGRMVMSWVVENVPENRLNELFKKVRSVYSSKWKVPPDDAIFIECMGTDQKDVIELNNFLELYCSPIKIEDQKRKEIE